jgi:hypothetical protein
VHWARRSVRLVQETHGREGRKEGRGRELIPDLAAIVWQGRRVTIIFDSGIATKPDVARAECHLAGTLTSAGAVVTTVRLPAAPDGSKVGLDDYLVTHTPGSLRALIEVSRPTVAPPETKEENAKPPGVAGVLAAIGLQFDLWHDATLTAFATTGRHSHAVKSKAFRHLLVNEYRKQTGKVPNGEALTNAITTVEAAAIFDGPERPAFVRVAGHDGRVYLHLAGKDSTVIEIDSDGWRECPNPPVRFRKPSGMLALPMPERGGHLRDLLAFLSVPDSNGFALVVAWLMGCFRPARSLSWACSASKGVPNRRRGEC